MTRPSAHPQGNRSSPAPIEVSHLSEFITPTPPTTLSTRANEVWEMVWDAGRDAYNVRTDGQVIARYAEMTARRELLLKTLDTEGWTTIGSSGQIVAHPAARLISDVDSKLQSLEDRLGLNPESRIRLGIATVEQKSRLHEFLDRQS